ncbi:MAG: nucleotidyltransferase domain-containing protein [Bacillota bacterium]
MFKEKRLLTGQEKKQIETILKGELSPRREISFAYLHGSFLSDLPCGDVDVALYLEEGFTSDNHWEYEAELAMLLDRKLGLPIDILTLNHAPVTLRYHATTGKVLFSNNELARYTFLEKTWREYFDYLPLLKAYLHDLLEQ